MQTKIKYYIENTKIESDCGKTLNIIVSSRNLNWDGVLLERGSSPYFYPKNIETPNFYFAIELSQEYKINIDSNDENISKSVEVGDIWINPPYTPFTHNIDNPCDFIIVTITKEKMFNSFIGIIPDNILFLNNYSIKDDVLTELINLLYIEVKKKLNSGEWYLDGIIGLISNHFIRNYSNYNDVEDNKSFGETQLKLVNKYINRNITESITIEELAGEINMSKFYFLREFKAYMKITPYQYIVKNKIEHSKNLLKNSKHSITDIALNLGFNDSSHFTRTFKQHEGVTPKQYRK